MKKILVMLMLGAFVAITACSTIGCDDKPSTKNTVVVTPTPR